MRLSRFAIVASFLSLPVGCGGSGATSATDAGADSDDRRWDVSARVGGQLRFVRFRTLGAADAHLGRQPGAVLDGEHDVRERDRVAAADARADRHGQAVPRRRDALARHADLRQGREPHQVREGLGRGVVAGADLHALAGRRLERARHRGPRPLRAIASRRNVMVYTGPPTTPPVTHVGHADAGRAGGDARLRSDGRLPRLRHRVDAGGGALHRRRRGEADVVGADRSTEASAEHPADDLGVGGRRLGGPDPARQRADQRRLRLDPRLQLGARRTP